MIEDKIMKAVDESPLGPTVRDLVDAVDEAVNRTQGAKHNLLNGVLPARDHSEFHAVMDRKVAQWAMLVKGSVYMDAAKELQLRADLSEGDIDAVFEAEEAVTVSFFDFALKQARNARDNPNVLASIDVNELELFAAGEKTDESMHAADRVITQISNGYLVRELAAELERRLTQEQRSPALYAVVDAPEGNEKFTALLRVVDETAGGDDPGYDDNDGPV